MTDLVTREMKPRPFGTSAEMVKRSLLSAGGPKRLAEAARRSLARIYSYRDQDAGRVPLEFLELMIDHGAREPVEYLAARAGGAFVPLEPRQESLTYVTARVLSEVADFAGGLMLDLDDGKLTEAEARQRLQEVEAAMTSLATARAHLNQKLEAGK